jgi:hypothetical protein
VKKLEKTKGLIQPTVTNVTSEAPLCTYLDDERPVLAFRRAVPKDLRPFIKTRTGRPRSEWRYSLGTKDKKLANERCHLETVRTDSLLKQARADRAAWLIENAKSPRERELERLRWKAERANEEFLSLEAAQDDWAFDEREPVRQPRSNHVTKT